MQRMVLITVVLGLLLWQWPALAATLHASENTFSIGADIDAQGRITALQPGAEIKAPVVAVLNEAAKSWRFVPVQRDGKAVPVHSFIRARLEVAPTTDGKYTIRVSCSGAGPLVKPPRKEISPDYPTDILGSLEAAGVLFAVHLDLAPDGKVVVTDIKTYAQGQSFRHKAMLADALKRWYERSSAVPETVDGQAVAATIARQIHVQLVAVDSAAAGHDPNDHLDAAQKAFLRESGIPLTDAAFSGSVLKPAVLPTVVLQP